MDHDASAEFGARVDHTDRYAAVLEVGVRDDAESRKGSRGPSKPGGTTTPAAFMISTTSAMSRAWSAFARATDSAVAPQATACLDLSRGRGPAPAMTSPGLLLWVAWPVWQAATTGTRCLFPGRRRTATPSGRHTRGGSEPPEDVARRPLARRVPRLQH